MIVLARLFLNLLHHAEAHWQLLLAPPATLCLLILSYRYLVTRFGPADLTGTGINIGAPKIFDNRSLTLMFEGLNSNLQTLNAVNPNLMQNPSTFQQGESVSSTNRIQVAGKTTQDANAAGGPTLPTGDQKTASASPFTAPQTFGISAPDALGDQLSLSYQIFNQRIVNERALSDRLYVDELRPETGPEPRLQIVLGFQVSINPPEGAQDRAAVAEIGLDFDGKPVSIVALIPQEKTYNAVSVSSSADSIDGSVVSPLFSSGGSASRQTDALFLHRDADTIAFERDVTDVARESAAFAWRKAKHVPRTVFGWEFHPVLGRRTVTPGTKLMLAVIALPCGESKSKAPKHVENLTLNVRTRAYWLSYNRKRQTTNVRWAWWRPYPSRQERISEFLERKPPLNLSSVAQSDDLKPTVDEISWVDTDAAADSSTTDRASRTGGTSDPPSSANSAVVFVKGQNFFSGTEVIIGGNVYNEKNGLTLKSNHALQVTTTVEALGKGSAVLNGRYGESFELLDPQAKNELFQTGIRIFNNRYYIFGNQALLCLVIVPGDFNPPLPNAGAEHSIGPAGAAPEQRRSTPWVEALGGLLAPLVYVNGRPLPRPYEVTPWSSAWDPYSPGVGEYNALRVKVWAPADWVKSGASVIFKVPFFGASWAALAVLQSVEYYTPQLTRISSDGTNTQLAIFFSAGLPPGTPLVAQLDKDYDTEPIDGWKLRLRIPSAVLANYSKLVLRNKQGVFHSFYQVAFLLDIPDDSRPKVSDPKPEPEDARPKSAS